jgi:hypothetical protein
MDGHVVQRLGAPQLASLGPSSACWWCLARSWLRSSSGPTDVAVLWLLICSVNNHVVRANARLQLLSRFREAAAGLLRTPEQEVVETGRAAEPNRAQTRGLPGPASPSRGSR